MTFLATNLQVLRKHYKRTQQAVADDLRISRSSLSSYELGTLEPPAVLLITMATHYGITVDRLLKHDLRTLSQYYMGQLERGEDKLFYLPACIHPVNPPK